MTTYKESFNLFTKEKALTYLSIVSSSLSNRINQINQIKSNFFNLFIKLTLNITN